MASILANLKTHDDVTAERDQLGGGGVLASGLYPTTVSLAYLNTATSGAIALVLHLKTSEGRDVRQTLWMTSGTAKGGKNYYIDRNDQKQYLPGFVLANHLALLTIGKEIGDLEPEDKVVSLYSFEARAEVPTKVSMFTDLIGQEILVGLIKQTVDKNQKNEATGEYEPTGETREENEIDKFFRAADRKTVVEIRAGADDALFADSWSEKWTGKSRDRSSKDNAGNGARSNGNGARKGSASTANFGAQASQASQAGAATAAAGRPVNSLFKQPPSA